MTTQTSLRNDLQLGILVGALFTSAWIALTWRYGFDLADEGFYWYGAQRMLHGEMPLRDFMSYDIGRYAWSAAVMGLLGDDGIFGARMASGAYQVCTMTVGVVLALRMLDGKGSEGTRCAFSLIVALLLNLWVHPYYKVFDYGTSLLIVAMLVLMFNSRSSRYWFGAGIMLGLAAIMGRNHGVYGAVAALLMLGFLYLKQGSLNGLRKPALMFVFGTAVGFSPTMVLAVLVEGFAAAFVESLRELFNSGSTNIGLPVPWPWTVERAELGWLVWGMEVLSGLAFMALLAVPIITIAILSRKPLARFTQIDALALCASLAGIVYAHYAFSRADLTHLALSIAPPLLVLASIGLRVGRPILISCALAGASVLALTPEKPFFAQFLLNKPLAAVSVNGSTLYIFPGIDRFLRTVDAALAAAGARHNFLAVPNAPALFAIYKQKMPLWEIYALWPRHPEFEAKEIERLASAVPQLVLLSNHALDDQEALRYSSTHPELYKWIIGRYETDATSLSYQSWKVMHKIP